MSHPSSPTVRDIQRRIEEALESLRLLEQSGKLPEELRPLFHFLSPPPGSTPIVALRTSKSDRKVRETAGANHWDLSENRAVIQFEGIGKRLSPKRSGAPKSAKARRWNFQPVRITGESLSTTLLNDRR